MDTRTTRGIRQVAAKLAATAVAAMLLAACSETGDESATASAEETATPEVHDGRELPTGGDYHSTAFRAHGRTQNKLDGIQGVRQEQKREEQSF